MQRAPLLRAPPLRAPPSSPAATGRFRATIKQCSRAAVTLRPRAAGRVVPLYRARGRAQLLLSRRAGRRRSHRERATIGHLQLEGDEMRERDGELPVGRDKGERRERELP